MINFINSGFHCMGIMKKQNPDKISDMFHVSVSKPKKTPALSSSPETNKILREINSSIKNLQSSIERIEKKIDKKK